MIVTDKEPPVRRGMSAEEAFVSLARHDAQVFLRHLRDCMEDDAPEPPHQARVALRRFRAALKGFAPILKRGFIEQAGGDARHLFRLLGRIRDADILAGLATSPRERAERLRAARDARTRARRKLAAAEADGFSRRIERLTEGKGWKRDGHTARRLRKAPVERLAAAALDAAWREFADRAQGVAEMSDRDRHALRIRLKTLRYLTEFFGPLWSGRAEARSVDLMKSLQDGLGHLNDLAVAGEDAPPDAARRRAELLTEVETLSRRLIRLGPWWA